MRQRRRQVTVGPGSAKRAPSSQVHRTMVPGNRALARTITPAPTGVQRMLDIRDRFRVLDALLKMQAQYNWSKAERSRIEYQAMGYSTLRESLEYLDEVARAQ
jgi:hypothetical protein